MKKNKNLTEIALKNLIKGLLQEQEDICNDGEAWNTGEAGPCEYGGCLDPNDNWYCSECVRDCRGVPRQGVQYSAIASEIGSWFGQNWEWNASDNNDDLGFTCCCEDSVWQESGWSMNLWNSINFPGSDGVYYDLTNHAFNACCWTEAVQYQSEISAMGWGYQFGGGAVGDLPPNVGGASSGYFGGEYICEKIEGCMDPAATNYVTNSSFDCVGKPQSGINVGAFGADWDTGWDGSLFDWNMGNNYLGNTCCCEYDDDGDASENESLILNYDETSEMCDEYEEYINPSGCTDPEAENYDENAVVDDGSCIYEPFSTETSPLRKPITCSLCVRKWAQQVDLLPDIFSNITQTQTIDGHWVYSGQIYPDPIQGPEGIYFDKPECPKNWVLGTQPCPPVSAAIDNIQCYRCDIDGQTVHTQFFPTQDSEGNKIGCPSPWDTDPNPCDMAGLTTQDSEEDSEGCPLEEFSCDTLEVWYNNFLTSIGVSGTGMFCSGCSFEVQGLPEGWGPYLDTDDPCFVGSLEAACACCSDEPGEDIYGCTSINASNYDSNATIDDGSCVWDDGGCETCDNCEDGCCYNFMLNQGCKSAEEYSTGANPLLFQAHEGYWNSCANENYEFVDNWPDVGASWINSPLNDQNLNDYCNGDSNQWNNGYGIYTDNTANVGSWASMWCSKAVCCQAAFNQYSSWYYEGNPQIDNWGGIESFNATNCVEFTGPIAKKTSIPNKNMLRERLQKLAGLKKKK